MRIAPPAIAFWAARTARERAVLAAAGVLAAAAALYAGLWHPGIEARRQLSTTLPRLRAQVEDMRLQKKEVELLRRAPDAGPKGADLRALLAGSLERSPLRASVERVEWRGSDRVLVAGAAIRFDQWLDWVGMLQRELGVRLESCRIESLAQPGMARIEATFAAPAARAP